MRVTEVEILGTNNLLNCWKALRAFITPYASNRRSIVKI